MCMHVFLMFLISSLFACLFILFYTCLFVFPFVWFFLREREKSVVFAGWGNGEGMGREEVKEIVQNILYEGDKGRGVVKAYNSIRNNKKKILYENGFIWKRKMLLNCKQECQSRVSIISLKYNNPGATVMLSCYQCQLPGILRWGC